MLQSRKYSLLIKLACFLILHYFLFKLFPYFSPFDFNLCEWSSSQAAAQDSLGVWIKNMKRKKNH